MRRKNIVYIVIYEILFPKPWKLETSTGERKEIKICILSTLTFVSLVHLIDAATAFLSSNQSRFLQIYPLINEYLTLLPLDLYLCPSAGSVFILWSIMNLTTFENLGEIFLNKPLSDVQKQGQASYQSQETAAFLPNAGKSLRLLGLLQNK